MTIVTLACSHPTAAPAAAAAARRRGIVRCRRAAPPPAALFRSRLTPCLGRTKSNNEGNHLGNASPGNSARPRIPAPAPATRGARVRPYARGDGGGGGGEKRDTQPKPSEGNNLMKKDMSDDEALGIIEKTLQARLSPTAARVISQGFLDIGVDAPAGVCTLPILPLHLPARSSTASHFVLSRETFRDRESDASACMRRHHAFALAPVNLPSLQLPSSSCPNLNYHGGQGGSLVPPHTR